MTDFHTSLPDDLSERVFQERVIGLARLGRWRIAHFRPAQERSGRWSTPMQGHKGFPDLVLARDGVVIFAELKTNKGRVAADQHDWIAELNPHGHLDGVTPNILAAVADAHALVSGEHYAVIWRPRDWNHIKTTLLTKAR